VGTETPKKHSIETLQRNNVRKINHEKKRQKSALKFRKKYY